MGRRGRGWIPVSRIGVVATSLACVLACARSTQAQNPNQLGGQDRANAASKILTVLYQTYGTPD